MAQHPRFPSQSSARQVTPCSREKGDSRELGEETETTGRRQPLFHPEEVRSLNLERIQRQFLNIMENLVPRETSTPQLVPSTGGESQESLKDVEHFTLPLSSCSSDSQSASKSTNPSLLESSVTVRVSSMNYQMTSTEPARSMPTVCSENAPSSMEATKRVGDAQDPACQTSREKSPVPRIPSDENAGSSRSEPKTGACSGREESPVQAKPLSSSDEEDEDEQAEKPMTDHHRELLALSRDKLVDSLIPDELFNILIAERIFTPSDVSRIRGTNRIREQINEELLNNLALRSNRAFHVFKKGLNKTLQSHLADLLNPDKNPRLKMVRKRRQNRAVSPVDGPAAKVMPTATTLPASTFTGTPSSSTTSTAVPVISQTAPSKASELETSGACGVSNSMPSLTGAPCAAAVGEETKKASSAFVNSQETVKCDIRDKGVTGSSGSCQLNSSFSSQRSSQPLQLLGRLASSGFFPGGNWQHAEETDGSDPEMEAPVFDEADPGSGAGSGDEAPCSYQDVERRFLEMAKNAYAQLVLQDGSPEALQQLLYEFSSTNAHLKTTAQLVKALRDVCKGHPSQS